MKSTQFTSFFLMTAAATVLSGCGNDAENDPQPLAKQTADVVFQLGMKGYADMPSAVARLGVASSFADAQIGKGTELTGTLIWNETKGGKETKSFTLPAKPVGTKYWVFLSTHQKPATSQSITVSWPVTGMATLSAAASDTLIVQEMTVQ
ncbi:hypothetical protein [Hymenobacter swuensis]|uniref:Uncharacterized protein n=1 Tax=Hymenobacter swuensis DY53 TaxID=1227739 RepID=W8F0V0_9BACT|nr:hypothetical protein [Hymenobacter swuensis]AHJ99004.1 hypothetical protein Hsw_3409 [Hymenobacter swuensis DY53]